MQQPDLRGRTALVTGGGRGIGRATGIALGRSGARVVLTARSKSEISEVAQQIESEGGTALAVPGDVSCEEDVRRLFDVSGPVDILINNAAVIEPMGPVASVDVHAWLHSIDVQIGGSFLTMHYALPHMIEQGWGRILNITAGVAEGRNANWSAYSTAKAGMETLSKVAAREVEARGVRVNAVRPGIVDTAMQEEIRNSTEEQLGRELLERYRRYKEIGMLRSPEDPAKLILWLLSFEADDINGQVVAIDDPEIAARIGVTPMGR